MHMSGLGVFELPASVLLLFYDLSSSQAFSLLREEFCSGLYGHTQPFIHYIHLFVFVTENRKACESPTDNLQVSTKNCFYLKTKPLKRKWGYSGVYLLQQ